jgi:hypothetical protein
MLAQRSRFMRLHHTLPGPRGHLPRPRAYRIGGGNLPLCLVEHQLLPLGRRVLERHGKRAGMVAVWFGLVLNDLARPVEAHVEAIGAAGFAEGLGEGGVEVFREAGPEDDFGGLQPIAGALLDILEDLDRVEHGLGATLTGDTQRSVDVARPPAAAFRVTGLERLQVGKGIG